MAVNIVEVNEFTTNVVTMEDGDNRDSSSVLAATQPLTNRTRFLGEYQVQIPLTPYALVGGGWAVAGPASDFGITQSSSGGSVTWGIDAREGMKIVRVLVDYQPGGSHGALPVQPTITLYRRPDNPASAKVSVASLQDNAASVVLYEQWRTLDLSLSHTITSGSYMLTFDGESGGNFQAGTKISRVLLGWKPA